MTDYFNAYGRALAEIKDDTIAAGRYPFQNVDLIVEDVIRKLNPKPEHRLLEIGFGTGQLLVPLARIVREAEGVDHEAAVARALRCFPSGLDGVDLIAGQWPDAPVRGTFDRILAYSVLQYTKTYGPFIEHAVDTLAPEGLLMLGDLPNRDAAARQSPLDAIWNLCIDGSGNGEIWNRDDIFSSLEPAWIVTDNFITSLLRGYRRRGFDAYVLPQPMGLPFFPGREDIIIRKPA